MSAVSTWYDGAVRSPRRKRLAETIVHVYHSSEQRPVFRWQTSDRTTVRLFTKSTSEQVALRHLKTRIAVRLGIPSHQLKRIAAKVGDDSTLRVIITAEE